MNNSVAHNLATFFAYIGENLKLIEGKMMDFNEIQEIEFVPHANGQDWWMHVKGEWMENGRPIGSGCWTFSSGRPTGLAGQRKGR